MPKAPIITVLLKAIRKLSAVWKVPAEMPLQMPGSSFQVVQVFNAIRGYQPYGKSWPRCPCKPCHQGAVIIFFTQVDYYHLDIKYLEPIGTLYIIYFILYTIYYILVLPHDFCHLSPVI